MKASTSTSIKRIVLLSHWFVFLLVGTTFAQVSLNNNFTKQYAQYSVTGAIPPRSFFDQFFGNYPNILLSGQGEITINFPTDTYVPTDLASENVQITGTNRFNETNTTTVQSLSVSGQSVTFTTPIDLVDGSNFTVTFLVAGKIKNPSTAGNYVISYSHTTSGGTQNLAVYAIQQSNTSLSAPLVSISPSIESRNAGYLVAFSTGAAGGMLANTDFFTLTFPSGTQIPNGNVAGVTINSIPAVAVGNSSTRVITVTTPIDLDNEEEVLLNFSLGSSINNPAAGSYTLSIQSSAETSVINSANYAITAATVLSNPSVTLGQSFVNATTSYSIRFTNGTTKSLVPFNDRLRITFPAEMQVPGTIDVSTININSGGFTDIPSQLTVTGNELLITTPVSIVMGDEVEILFSSGAGISNPALTGSYTLSLQLEESDGTLIEGPVTSSSFLISQAPSTTSKSFVDLSNSSTSTNSTYTINFNTGQFGKLTSGVSTIHIALPQDTRFRAGTAVSVNGTNAPTFSTLKTHRRMTINFPVTIENNSPIHLIICPLRNPAAAAAYTIDLYTSTEQTPIRSNTYNVGYTAISNVTFTISNLGVNQTTQYVINGTTNANMFSISSISDYFRIILPEDVEIPASIATNDITFRVGNSNQAIRQINVSQTNRYIDIYPNVNVNGGSNVRFTIPAAVGVRNPAVPSNSVYRGTIYSTADLEPVNSAPIAYTSNAVAAVLDTVILNPSVIDASNVKYTVRFTTGANGRLLGSSPAGPSTIDIVFPTGATTVPASMNAGDILINNQAASAVQVLTPGSTNGRIRISLAQNQVIEGNETVTVVINENAGLDNGTTAGIYRARISTSSESTLSAKTNTMSLLNESSLEVPSLAVSPRAINSPAAFTVKIKPGFNNDVAIGEFINIRFPNESTVPGAISRSYILVNGNQPTQNIVVNGKTISIPSPIVLAGETQATISISSLAGVSNPPTVASTWRVFVSTTKETTEIASPTYSTELATSTITSPTVTLSNNAISQAANYTISFNTGAQGALTSGSSIITIRMPNGTVYGTLSATVNGFASSSVTRSGNDIFVQVPASAVIGSSSAVSVIISGLTNPSTIGNYQLLARTNVENTFVNSSSYSLALLAAPITIPAAPVISAATDTVNINSAFTIPITLAAGGELVANTGTITIEFPEGIEFPNSIPAGSITINGTSVTSASINFAQRRLVLTTPVNLAAAVQHSISISTDALIKNPPQPGEYSLRAATSAQPLLTSTSTFTIVPSIFTQISQLGLEVSPTTADTPLRWTWTMVTGNRGGLMPGRGEIKLNFDNATNLSGVTRFDLTVNGVNPLAVRDSLTYLIITIPASLTVKNQTSLTIVLNEGANVQIPSVVGKFAAMKAKGGDEPRVSDLNEYSASSSSEPTETKIQLNPLPVELADFTVSMIEHRSTGAISAKLEWVTLTESENYGFKVVRRLKSENEDVQLEKSSLTWDECGFLAGQGYSTERVTYSFTDSDLAQAGIYEYQLIQMDFSGKTTTYGPLEFNMTAPISFDLYQNYPNPFNPSTTIPYSIARTGKVSIKVYDILGRLVQTLVNQEVNPGRYTAVFNASQFASGVYLIQMQAEGKVYHKKMLLLK